MKIQGKRNLHQEIIDSPEKTLKLHQSTLPEGVRDPNAYFGAPDEPLTDEVLFEGFGFVPSVRRPSKSEESIAWTGSPGKCPPLVFHSNEYANMSLMYNAPKTCENEESKHQLSPLHSGGLLYDQRSPLKDLTNFNSNEDLLTVDQKLQKEVELMMQNMSSIFNSTTPPSLRKLEPRWDTTNHIAKKRKPSQCGGELDQQLMVQYRAKRFPGDLYTPSMVRGFGADREGLCDLCIPGIWLKVKTSAYWYHLNFYHGISAYTGLPYDPPVEYREVMRELPNGNDCLAKQGRCGSCDGWITYSQVLLGGPKETPKTKGRNLDGEHECAMWWRHVQKCQSSRLGCAKRRGKAKSSDD